MLISSRAEEELKKYRTGNIEERTASCLLFLRNHCGWTPYPHQIFYIDQALRNIYNLLYAPPRSGKTYAMEAVGVYETAVNPFEDGVIYVPKYEQGKDALKYHLEFIEKSKLLSNYIKRTAGKREFSKIGYKFQNLSNWRIMSILGKIEGHNVTIMRIEEFDDWVFEKFSNDVVRRGGAKNKNGQPTRVRVTGTIMGKENIYTLANDPKWQSKFKNLSVHDTYGVIDVYTLLAMGVLDEEFVEFQRISMTQDEWARSMLLLFTEISNFFTNSMIRNVQKKMMVWGVEGVPFIKGGKYQKVGKVSFGFDCGHGGDSEESSKYKLVFIEEQGAYHKWLNGFTWDAQENPKVIHDEVCELIAFYGGDGGYGDALKMNDIAIINDMLYANGVTGKSRYETGTKNTVGNWDDWFFSPLWNDAKNKHDFYTLSRTRLEKGLSYIPYYDRNDDTPTAIACRDLVSNLENVRMESSKGRYPMYYGLNKKIGDDTADAYCMAEKWLNDHTDVPVNYGLIQGRGVGTKMGTGSILKEIESRN